MKRLPRPAAIIFDLDGVLWDSASAHDQAYRAVLEPLGIEMPPYSLLAGRRTDEVMRDLLAGRPEAAEPSRIAEIVEAKQSEARARLRRNPPVIAGCQRVLADLATKSRLALASSASRSSVALFTEVSATLSFFETILCGDDVPCAKPAPDIYLEALRRLDLEARFACVIEDSASGIAAAAAAGIPVIHLSVARHASAGGFRPIATIAALDELLSLWD